MVTSFDPLLIARRSRGCDLHLATDQSRDAFAPDRLGNAGRSTVEALIPVWLVGEQENYRDALTEALAWIGAGAAAGDGGDPVDCLLQRRALGIGRWLLDGRVDRALWAEAADLSEEVLRAEAPAPYLVSDHMLDCLLAADSRRAESAPTKYPAGDDAPEIQAALALARGDAAVAVGRLYADRSEDWLAERVFRRIAIWAMAAWFESGLAKVPEAALLALYAFLDGVRVPPALAERGWQEETVEAVCLALRAGVPEAQRDGVATALGLIRDPDRGTPQHGVIFASWTGPMGDTGELDWLDEDGVVQLQVRGHRAAMRGNVLMELLGARPVPPLDEALAALLTPPRGPPQSSTGFLRWQTLRMALAAAGPANRDLIHALVAAGLRDPDWRVRMTAVLAVGQLGLADLGEIAMAAPVPAAGVGGLTQEDRRSLLALRHAARNLALGLVPEADLAGEPGSNVMAKRIAHQKKLRALLQGATVRGAEAEALLIAALLGRVPPDAPARWQNWLQG